MEEKPDGLPKYFSRCIHSGIFNYNCFLYIEQYTKQDIGKYSAKIRLKSRPDIKIELNSNAIMPSKILTI